MEAAGIERRARCRSESGPGETFERFSDLSNVDLLGGA
jgi:hypothetical protein